MIHRSAFAGSRRSVRKTIDWPSGVHEGWLAKRLSVALGLGVSVTRRSPVPSWSTIQISVSPSGPARNATRLPSGDHAAWPWLVSSAIRRYHEVAPGVVSQSRFLAVNTMEPLPPANAAWAGDVNERAAAVATSATAKERMGGCSSAGHAGERG